MEVARRYSIAIVDDHPIVRQGLASVIGSVPDFDLIAEGVTASDAISISKLRSPDVLLLDMGNPALGIDALKQITLSSPTVRCVIFTVCDDANVAIQAMNAGAKGYILKGVSAGDLKSAIRTVLADASFISPDFAGKLLQAAQAAANRSGQASNVLNFREAQIISRVESGMSNKQIAEVLHMSEKTVKYYMTSIMQKYRVHNRVSAVLEFQKQRREFSI